MANIIERDIFVLRDASSVAQPIEYVQGTNAVPILLHIRDYDIPTDSTARVYVEWPSTKGEYDESGVTIDGNDILIKPKDTLFSEVGKSQLQVCIVNGDETLVTFSYPVMVKKNRVPGITEASKNHSDFLDEYLTNIEEKMEITAQQVEGTALLEASASKSAASAKSYMESAKASEQLAEEYKNKAFMGTPEGYEDLVDTATATESESALHKQTLGYTSKNLIPYPYYETSHTEDNITWTDNGDGTLTANGTNDTSSGSEFILFPKTERILEAGNYIINGIPDGASNSTYHIFLNYYIDGTYNKSLKFNKEIEFTLSEDDIKTYTFLLGVRVMNGMTVNNLTFKPMIRRAEIADNAYEPYVPSVAENVRKIKNDTTLAEQTLGYECKNLIPYPYANLSARGGTAINASVTITDNGNGSVTLSGTSTASTYSSFSLGNPMKVGVDLEIGVPYIFTEPSSNNYRYAGLLGYKDGKWVKDLVVWTSKKEFVLDDSVDEVRLVARRRPTDDSADVTFYPMLRRAEIADDTWEPYRPHIANELALIRRTLGYECKNLIRYPFYMGEGEYSGITVVDNGDGTLTLNGAVEGDSYVAIHLKAYNILPLLSDMDKTKKYVLSGCPSGGSTETYFLTMAFRTADNVSVSPRVYDTGEGVVIDMSKYPTASKCQIVIWLQPGTKVSNLTFKPMLRRAEITDGSFKSYVPSIRDEIDDLKKNKYGMLSYDNAERYVDGTNGSDDNDGSKSAPFKTFDRFLEEYSKHSELKCYFIGSCAEYTMNSIETFNAIGMHLTNQSSNANITIHFNGVTTPAFYNSHLNVYGLESKYITLDIPNNLYFDGGSVGMGYAHITNGKLSFLGCFAELKNLTFENSHIRVIGCACKLQNAIFTGSAEYCIVGIDGASIYVQSSIIVNSTASSSVVYGHGADFKLGCILQMTEANKGFEMYNCTILCEENRFDDWNVNDSYFYGTAVLGYEYQMLTSK